MAQRTLILCYQQITIPANVASATLSFWVRIDTAETTTTTQFDRLQVQIRNSSNTVLATLATYSNLDKNSSYVLKTFNLNAYRGQTDSRLLPWYGGLVTANVVCD